MSAQIAADKFFKEFSTRMPEVLNFLTEQISGCGYPIYTSLDIRDAGWKVVVVDVNLFPAGFNRLSSQDRLRGATRMREFLSAKLLRPAPWKITVVPEAHTNNKGYLENLAGILELLKNAGCETKLLWPGPSIPKPWKLQTPSGFELEYLPPELALEGAEALILNHDLSGGIPKAIQGVNLPKFPSVELGWYKRRKSKHDEIVAKLLTKLQKKIDFFDPWYFSAASQTVTNVDFDSEAGLKQVSEVCQKLYADISESYKQRSIPEKPTLFVKNDAGTYGMGVVSIQDPAQIAEGSRWLRNKMRKGKEAVPISQVIIQEGIPTALHYLKDPADPSSEVAAEPVLYMINGVPIGGFMRIHEKLGPQARFENLNQPGSLLETLDCDKNPQLPRPFFKPRGKSPCDQIDRAEVYFFLARLHAVAASLEECKD